MSREFLEDKVQVAPTCRKYLEQFLDGAVSEYEWWNEKRALEEKKERGRLIEATEWQRAERGAKESQAKALTAFDQLIRCACAHTYPAP